MIGWLVSWPLLPVRGLVALANTIADEADKEMYGMPSIRRQLDELVRAEAAGRITAEERREAEQELVSRLVRVGGTRR